MQAEVPVASVLYAPVRHTVHTADVLLAATSAPWLRMPLKPTLLLLRAALTVGLLGPAAAGRLTPPPGGAELVQPAALLMLSRLASARTLDGYSRADDDA